MQATITLEYSDDKTATAIAKAISPENSTPPHGLNIKSTLINNSVVTNITFNGKLATFISTIDDLLESASTAEKTLHIIKQK